MDAGRHQAGEAVRLRRVGATRPHRSSGSRETRCRRWSASSCSCAPPCGAWAAIASCTGRSSPPSPETTCTGKPTASSTSCGPSVSLDGPVVVAGPHDRRPGVPSAPLHGRGQCADPASRRHRRGRRRAGRRAPHRPRSVSVATRPSSCTCPHGPPEVAVTTPVPVAISVRPHRARPESVRGRGHAARGAPGRPLRAGCTTISAFR